MKTPAYHKSLETLHVNCLEPRAYFIPFADEKTAASRERSESDYFVPLCGEWDFRFFKSFEDVLREPPEYVGERGFDKISVPRSWQTYTDRGYDVPLYSNLEYPFPTDPPFVPDENPSRAWIPASMSGSTESSSASARSRTARANLMSQTLQSAARTPSACWLSSGAPALILRIRIASDSREFSARSICSHAEKRDLMISLSKAMSPMISIQPNFALKRSSAHRAI